MNAGAARIDDRQRTTVRGFNNAAAGRFDEGWIHGSGSMVRLLIAARKSWINFSIVTLSRPRGGGTSGGAATLG